MKDDIPSKATEMMKKILTVGVGTLFLTEESLRNLISEIKIPKEILSGILDSANKTKNEFFKNLSQEVIGRVTDKMDLRTYIQEVLEKNEIDLHVRIRFKPKKKSKDSNS